MTAQPATYFGVTPNRPSGVTPAPKQDKRYRFQMRFWVDLEKAEERWLADYAAYLKAGRNFHETVRQGLRLIHDLRQGKTDVLFEMFPFVAHHQPLNEERLAALIAARLGSVPAARPVALTEDTDTVEVKTVADNGTAIETFLQSAAGLQGKPTAPKIKGISGAALTLSAPDEEDE